MQSKIRSLASDTLVYGVSTVLSRFLTFLLTPLYTNFLAASEIGDVTAIYAAIAFVNILYSLGLEPAFMRFWETDKPAHNQSVFRTAFLGVAGVGVVIAILTIVFAGSIATSAILQLGNDGASLIRIATLIPLFDALVLIPFARLRMQRKAKQFAMLRLAAVVINVALNVWFVVMMDWHVYGVVWAGALSSAASFLMLLPQIRLHRTEGGSGLFIRMLKFGLPTIPASFSSVMVLMADRTVMLLLTSSAVLGLYQTNFRLALPMMMFVTVFEYAWKPFYLQHRDDPDAKHLFSRVFTLFTVACGLIFLGTALLMPYVVRMPFIGGRFINPEYWSGMSIIPVVMVAYYFNGVFVNLSAGLHITMRTGWFPVATGVAAVVNVAVMVWLVPIMGIMGAAVAKVAAYAASVLAMVLYLRHVYPVSYDLARVAAVIGLVAVVFYVATLPPELSPAGIAVRSLAIPLFVLLLVGLNVIQRGTLQSVLSMFRKRVP